jgi:outer membrane cobalamin receptor
MSAPPQLPFSHARRAALIAGLVVGWSAPALAANLGIVHGSVHDEAGKPIPGTQVSLLRGTQQLDMHRTDSAGHFEFEQMPFGKYRLTFSAPDGRMDDREVLIASGDVLELDVTLPTLEETVTVVAPKREAPPPTTTTGSATQVQREDIQSKPRGDSASVNEVLATQPGFVYDALGQIYVRGNHGNIQYQLDGVPLPDTVSGLFGQFLTARLLENMEVITGGLPAEYGQRLSAVVNLNSRRPAPEGEGRFDLLYGSYNTVSPGGYWGQKVGSVSYLVGGSLNWTERGLDPPNPTTYLNNDAQQGRVFAKVDVDLNDRDHLSTLLSYSHDRFQIPIDPTLVPGNTQTDELGNPPSPYFPPDTSQTETENDVFGILSYRHDFDASKSLRIAGYVRHSAAKFFGDPEHALGSTQVCTDGDCPGVSNVNRRADHVGLVTDYLQRLGDQHTLKFGLSVDQLWGNTAYDAYQRELTPPPDFSRIGQGADEPTATTGGIYAQDRFTAGKLTITGGLRADFQSASPGAGAVRTSDVGVSPRLGAAWAFTPDLVAHAFFGLMWIPPSVTDAAAGARLTPGAVQPGQPIPYDLRPEKDRYAEVGLKARVVRPLTLGITLWGRTSTDQLDETEIGNTGITTPYNYLHGRAGGIEATADWVITQRLTAFGNVSFGTAQGKEIATAKYLFDDAQKANKDWQTLDHAQTWTANAGASYRDGPTLVTVQTAYGSGLRTGANNDSHVPGWVRVDLTLAHDFLSLPLRPTLAIDVVNLFDAQYAYRLYNGFNGSHWAPGRSVYVRGSVNF